MRSYFADIGFILHHRPATHDTPEAWWLADGEGTPYPMPADFRILPDQAGHGPVREAEEFPSPPRLWRAWATTVYRFAREAHCSELISERMADASDEERRKVIRWVRSGAACCSNSLELNAPLFDVDGNEVDESVWPWSAMTWHDSLPELVSQGWPWAMVPLTYRDGLDVQRMEGWADEAKWLSFFDTRYPETYFDAVRIVLAEVLPELEEEGVRDGETIGGKSAGSSGGNAVDWAEVGSLDTRHGRARSLH
jgi:hypothetical protein